MSTDASSYLRVFSQALGAQIEPTLEQLSNRRLYLCFFEDTMLFAIVGTLRYLLWQKA
jgi:hypothetical protein